MKTRKSGFEDYKKILPGSELNLLAIDTSTSSTVLGLKKDNVIIDYTVRDVRTHSREILQSISSLLLEVELSLSELDGIIFGQGPGSFTGLRITIGVVQGLAYGADLRVIPVSSMSVMAQAAVNDRSIVLVALLARREEIYYGTYELKNGLAVATTAEGVRDITELDLELPDGCLLITDAPHLEGKISESLGVCFSEVSTQTVPAVTDLLSLGLHKLNEGGSVSALEASPVYLREQVTTL